MAAPLRVISAVALLCLVTAQLAAADCPVGSGFYGPDCTACPVCQNLGKCQDGPDGNGTCACLATTTGTLCELCAPNYDPDTQCTSILDACASYVSETAAEDSSFAKWCKMRPNGDCITDFDVVPTRSTCGCQTGYTFNEATQTCDDVNECKSRPCVDVAYSVCTNLVGTYNCTCKRGYEATVIDPLNIVRTCAKPIPPTTVKVVFPMP
ncbi:hypothetical protein CLOM_g11430 [Closterium sp. NIES-68]|nr:hypothetical protein CLOM_g11430 [Closterium sp. NIES-68]GJP72946.1 hypothetical protein CLOP_g3714 [Closterium sp. NIES-67]